MLPAAQMKKNVKCKYQKNLVENAMSVDENKK